MKALLIAFVIATCVTSCNSITSCRQGGDTCYMAQGMNFYIWPILFLFFWALLRSLMTDSKKKDLDEKNE
jgi:hypothetical protein